MGSRNPLYEGVDVPDKIINAPALNPQAQVIGSPFKAPTVANVAETSKVTTLEQLSRALNGLLPVANQGIQKFRQKADEADVEKANAQWQESKNALGDATRTGKIPPGESQLFNDTWRSLDAQDTAKQYSPALWTAWSQNPDASNPDKPQAFEEFRQKFRSQWDQDHLRDADTGNAKFTPHQLLTARYNETLDVADQHLTGHNTNVLVDALTEKGKDTLSKNIQTSITQARLNIDGTPKSPETVDWDAAAKSVREATYGQTTGLVTAGGLPTHLATEVQATAVAQQIMDSHDISIGQKLGAALDKLDPAHPITGTQKWKSIIQAASEHAVSQQTQTLRNKAWLDERTAQGGDDAINRRTKEITAISDDERTVNWHTKADANMILSPKDLTNPTPEESKVQGEAFNRLFKYNPEKAQFLTKEIRGLKEHAVDRIDKDRYSQNEVDIYQAIEKAPGSSGTADLIDQARKGNYIDGPTWQRLRQENKEMGMAKEQFKGVLDSPTYTNLEQGVKNSLIDPQKPFGEQSIAAAQAAHEFRQEAISTLQHNPGMDASQLSKVMEPRMQAMHLKYNETAKQIQAQRDEDAKIEARITAGALSRDQANAVMSHDGQTFKNKNGETVTQTHEQTKQILRATEEQNAINKADKHSENNWNELDTKLSAANEKRFQEWKKVYAPRDSGADYDLRGAFKAGLRPDPTTGHWPDTYKKPNHPTFSDESKYAEFGSPGHWNGDTFAPGKKSPQTGNELQLPKEVSKYLSGPTPEKLAEHMTTPEKQSIMESVRLAYEPGIKEKPISPGVMRDQVREVLSRHYTNAHELNDAVNHVITGLTARYQRKPAQTAKK